MSVGACAIAPQRTGTGRIRGLVRGAGIPLALMLASAWLLRTAVPPEPVAPLAWVALVPLVLALRNRSPAAGALIGYVFGVASLAAMHSWFFHLPGANVFNAAALFGYLAIYAAVWCAALALLMRRQLPWLLPGAVLWALLEWVRSHAGFLAAPWDPLSHSQVADPLLLQLASFGGAPAIACLVCLFNLAVSQAVALRSLRPLAVPATLLAAVHLIGFWHLRAGSPAEQIKAAVIQPANEALPHAERFRPLEALTLEAARFAPELVVWPESAVPGIALQTSRAKAIAGLAAYARAPILFGSADYGKFAVDAGRRAEQTRFENEALVILPDGSVRGPVIKNRLVPFAEYMPLGDRISWPRWLVARQLHGVAGAAPEILELRNGTRIGVSICWESLFSGLTDRLVKHGASVIVQLSNDSDFGASAEPSQHAAASVLRAVEYGRSILLSSTAGPSMLVDTHGRVIAGIGPQASAGLATGTVPLSHGNTVYRRLGLLWLLLASVAAALQILYRPHLERWRT